MLQKLAARCDLPPPSSTSPKPPKPTRTNKQTKAHPTQHAVRPTNTIAADRDDFPRRRSQAVTSPQPQSPNQDTRRTIASATPLSGVHPSGSSHRTTINTTTNVSSPSQTTIDSAPSQPQPSSQDTPRHTDNTTTNDIVAHPPQISHNLWDIPPHSGSPPAPPFGSLPNRHHRREDRDLALVPGLPRRETCPAPPRPSTQTYTRHQEIPGSTIDSDSRASCG